MNIGWRERRIWTLRMTRRNKNCINNQNIMKYDISLKATLLTVTLVPVDLLDYQNYICKLFNKMLLKFRINGES